MKVNEPEVKGTSAFERHSQMGIQIIMCALLMWIGNSTVQTREAVVALQVNATNMAAMISQMQAEITMIRTNATTAALAATTAAALAATTAAQNQAERRR